MKRTVYLFVVASALAFFARGVIAAEHPMGHSGEHSGEHSQEHPSETEVKKIDAAATPVPKLAKDQLVLTGTVFCTACDLKKKGAKSQCSVYGCSFAFRPSQVVNPKGEYVKEALGKTYQFLANENSAAIMKKEIKGKELIIVGKLYPEENVLEVDFVKFVSKKNETGEKPAPKKEEKKAEHPEHPKE